MNPTDYNIDEMKDFWNKNLVSSYKFARYFKMSHERAKRIMSENNFHDIDRKPVRKHTSIAKKKMSLAKLGRINIKNFDLEAFLTYWKDHEVTLYKIGKRFNICPKTAKHILKNNGIINLLRTPKRIHSAETRRKMSDAKKGKPNWKNKMSTQPESIRRGVMAFKMNTSIDLSKYEDFDRLCCLTKHLARWKKEWFPTDIERRAFLDKFYFDPQFNAIYDHWVETGNPWAKPSLDHKICKINGGGWSLDNLQFLTWFENRTKSTMNDDEWLSFIKDTNTTSSLFIRVPNHQSAGNRL